MSSSSLKLLLLTGLFFRFCGPSASSELSPCQISTELNSGGLVVQCRNLGLHKVPKHIFTKSIVELDLSNNPLKVLGSSSFLGLISTRKLNISRCSIGKLFNDTFKGLVSLKELDLKNNPIIQNGLPDGIFTHLPQLVRLFVSGPAISTDDIIRWGDLKSLEEIILTPGPHDNFTQLTRLPKLRSVYFVACRFGSILKRTMMRALRNSTIKELAFVICRITVIENGAFDGLLSLDVLNLAGNLELSVDNVIDVLSTSDANVSTLILDCVGSRNRLFLAGLREKPSCRRAWNNVKRLSIRGINLVAILEPMTSCLPKLEVIALGFNTISKCAANSESCVRIISDIGKGLQHLDISYLQVSDAKGLMFYSGYRYSSNWLLLNDDYFPHVNLPEYCPSPTFYNIPKTNISIHFFSCLTYLAADNTFRNVFTSNYSQCYTFPDNNLKYLNLSSRFSVSDQIVRIRKCDYNFRKLVVLDISRFGISFIDLRILQTFPSLEALNLSRNYLGKTRIRAFPVSTKLTDLNLADNYFARFPSEQFTGLTSLRRLDLSGNRLTELGFILPSTLEYLDVSRNLLTLIEPAEQSLLDQLDRFVFNAIGNPFQCDCPETAFIKWYQETKTNISNYHTMTCSQGIKIYKINEINLSHLQLDCGLTVNIVVLISTTCGMAVIITAIYAVLHRFQWEIRWKYHKLRHKRSTKTRDMPLLTATEDSHYNYCVICPYKRVERWIYLIMESEIETKLQIKLFIPGRDDSAGQTYIDGIVEGITKSRAALWFLCPEFFEEKLCWIAAHYALIELGPSNNVLVILEDEFHNFSIPDRFHKLLSKNMLLPRVVYRKETFSEKLNKHLSRDEWIDNWELRKPIW